MNIAGGEGEFTIWGFKDLIGNRCVDVLQPEVCGLGGITEYKKILGMAQAHFVPVVNHVWGSAVAVATNMHLIASLPDFPGAAHPVQPMLEYDTTPNKFREDILEESLDILGQVKRNDGFVDLPKGPGLGIEPDRDFLARYAVTLD